AQRGYRPRLPRPVPRLPPGGLPPQDRGRPRADERGRPVVAPERRLQQRRQPRPPPRRERPAVDRRRPRRRARHPRPRRRVRRHRRPLEGGGPGPPPRRRGRRLPRPRPPRRRRPRRAPHDPGPRGHGALRRLPRRRALRHAHGTDPLAGEGAAGRGPRLLRDLRRRPRPPPLDAHARGADAARIGPLAPLPRGDHGSRPPGDPVVAGVDLGGTNVKGGLVDRSGRVTARFTLATADFDDPRRLAAALAHEVGVRLEDRSLLGIGIGAPNGNYYRGTV